MAAVRVIASPGLGSPSHPVTPLPGRRTLAACAAAVIAFEILAAVGGALVGSIAYAVLILWLVHSLALAVRRGGAAALGATSAAMVLVPLCLRLVTLTIEGGPLPVARHYALVGGTAVAALAYATLAFPELRPRLERSAWQRGQVMVALSGLPIGLIYALAFDQGVVVPEHGARWNTPELLGLAVGAAVTEELLFRGFLQTAFAHLVGRLAPVAAAAALLVAYLGARPTVVVAAVALGLCSGLIVERTGRLEGVVIGHALLNAGLFVLWPSVLHLH